MVKILIPTPLRQYVGDASTVEAAGATVGEVLQALIAQHDAMRRHLLDDAGEIRSFVNVYLNDEDIRHLDRSQTVIAAGDVLSIVPSVAGGN
ncbi:MAG: molybdopterin synthase sulfur carrier subunit [Gemmatimonadota bacterium]|nr:MAG: molybdopterin synthase sulfur carrier subunit [Gemmatimonadota bacterium]